MKTLALGCCGLNCDECPVFIATVRNDDKLRQKTAEEWSKLYAPFLGKELRPEDINCRGCRSEGSLFIGCMTCQIRECCRERKLPTCASCNEYETCETLSGFFSYHHQQAKVNLDRVREGRADA